MFFKLFSILQPHVTETQITKQVSWLVQTTAKNINVFDFSQTSKVISWCGLSIVVDLEYQMLFFFYLKRVIFLLLRANTWKNGGKPGKTELGQKNLTGFIGLYSSLVLIFLWAFPSNSRVVRRSRICTFTIESIQRPRGLSAQQRVANVSVLNFSGEIGTDCP